MPVIHRPPRLVMAAFAVGASMVAAVLGTLGIAGGVLGLDSFPGDPPSREAIQGSLFLDPPALREPAADPLVLPAPRRRAARADRPAAGTPRRTPAASTGPVRVGRTRPAPNRRRATTLPPQARRPRTQPVPAPRTPAPAPAPGARETSVAPALAEPARTFTREVGGALRSATRDLGTVVAALSPAAGAGVGHAGECLDALAVEVGAVLAQSVDAASAPDARPENVCP
jgi:hypothetical protein